MQQTPGTRSALVTGGAGFIGSHLVEELVRRGWRVTVLDDMSSGSERNLVSTIGHPDVELYIGSVRNEPLVSQLIADADAVFHLASVVGVQRVLDNPLDTLVDNALGGEVVLRLSARAGCKVVVASSSEVYGNLREPVWSEATSLALGPPKEVRPAYAVSKLFLESLTHSYWRSVGLEGVAVRLFNVIGPRQSVRLGMVVPRFVEQALSGAPLTVYGDGSQTRSFIWVGDAVKAMVDLLDVPAAFGQVVNVGGDRSISILDLARLVVEIAGSTSEIEFVPHTSAYGRELAQTNEVAETNRGLADLTVLRSLIAFQPIYSLEEVVGKIIDDMRQLTPERGHGSMAQLAEVG